MMIMSAVARSLSPAGPAGRCCAMKAIRRMTEMGIGLTLLTGGSSFFQAAHVRAMRKSVLCAAFKRGSLVPIARNVWATARK